MVWLWVLGGIAVLLATVALHDITQKRHTVLHNFPIVGHFRYILESFGPELRQYIVTSNNEERPFSRDQRSWVYASAKRQNEYFGFGSDNEMEGADNYLIIKHSAFPLEQTYPGHPDFDPQFRLPCAKILGGHHRRRHAFRPASVVNISGMSFGALSKNAVEAMNRGAALAGCLHNTGEGGVSEYHDHGGDLIWQIGSGYFGCRRDDGRFGMDQFRETLTDHPRIRAIEVKLSQGAKPGVGGMLPACKITPELARARKLPMGRDIVSPPSHPEFGDIDGLIDFVEMLAGESGLPVGIKSAVGDGAFWHDLAYRMRETGRGPDFLTIDGGEGGTGAGPLVFGDHVALPFKAAFSRVYSAFSRAGMAEKVVFIGSAKLGFPESALLAFGMGCDMINVGREAMLAIGCIQAQKCHTDHCPTGVTTHKPWRVAGVDPTLKSVRLANYLLTLRKELCRLTRACGVLHPALITLDSFEFMGEQYTSRNAREIFDYRDRAGLPSEADQRAIERLMTEHKGAIPETEPVTAKAG